MQSVIHTFTSTRPANPASWRKAAPVVLPSLLLCDFGNLQAEVERLESAGVRALHLDVMDGHFVPNLTYGLPIVAALRRLTKLPLDVHLMISEPAKYIDHFVDAGADAITFHVEAQGDPGEILGRLRRLGVLAGIALNPPTPLSAIVPLVGECDLILVMSVMPGFGGQAFDEVALEKLAELRRRGGERVLLEVDGGVNARTISRCAEAGAELFVVGSAIFGQSDYGQSVTQLTDLAQRNRLRQQQDGT